ncbi:MAG: efflux RND transporter periplasmic adaptor subunit [Acidobacteria bacterium]|nr:efflux RND transporter periplasmic adaptor subunit [Acidobacteriota bacterium]
MLKNFHANAKPKRLLIIGALLAVGLFGLVFFWSSASKKSDQVKAEAQGKAEHQSGEGREVELSTEALNATAIETAEVTSRALIATLRFTGSVEANQQQTQQITPLIGGRVERVLVALGDRVRAGQVLAIISSPEIAEMHGKLHEAETRLEVAENNFARVQRAENRATLIQAKARLDEADATLRRTRKLVDAGAGAGKDLVAAEAAYQSAKAEYDYQNNISINREVQQAKADFETARVEVLHLKNSLRALGASVSPYENSKVEHNTARIALVAPISGSVTERVVNAGAGIEAGKPLFTIANLATVWVIANVQEAQINRLRLGTPASIRVAALADITGRITYLDPTLNEETRTARVRIEVANPYERLKVGMFVEISFAALNEAGDTGAVLAVPESAVQRLADRAVVFVQKDNEAGHFAVREIEVGSSVGGFTKIISGLSGGEKVVTKGSFVLKTQLMKSELGEEH